MCKRILSVCLCLAMVIGFMPAFSVITEPETVSAASTNLVTLPANDGLTNNVTYTLGAGTDAEVSVNCDFRSASLAPNDSQTPKYIVIHCMGNYTPGADAKANHTYGKTASGVAWHYTVGEEVIYQMLADTRMGWHVGSSNTGAPANYNSIGLELVVDNFPASSGSGGEYWNDGDAIMAWWESQFDQTMKNAAYLTLVLCKRWGLDWQTRIKMHWDSMQYDGGARGKDCPMQMRATYDPATNTFSPAGMYVDGRDGYFWQMFWGYLEAYANGATSVDGSTGTTATRIGTYQVSASEGLNVRTEPDGNATKLGALEGGAIVEVTEISGNWGKITYEGQTAWCSIVNYGKYIGIDAQAYELGVNSDGLMYSYDSDGSLTLTNTASSQGQFDMFLPQAIGTNTTPYMSLQVTPLSGSGYYFGITQEGSAYWMMRDCQSGDQLVVEHSAPYMTNTETLEINVREWWQPENDYQIDQVRFYIAPKSSIKINYFYFAAESGTVVDTRYNLRSASTNVTLMQPDTLDIVDRNKTGSYTYYNGMLTVVAGTDKGYEVVFYPNATFDVNTLTRLLIGIESDVRFDVELTVTHAGGEGKMALTTDYYNQMGFEATDLEGGYIPAWTGTSGLDLYNYYYYNSIVPTDGMSTVKQVKVILGGAGTLYLNSIQLAENDRILNFPDGVSKSDSSMEGTQEDIIFESSVYTVNTAVVSRVEEGTTVSEFLSNVTSSYTVIVYENGEAVDNVAIAKTGQIVKVINGTEVLASYEIAVTGDVNGDGDMDTTDLRELLVSLVDEPLIGLKAIAADVNGSGVVDSTNAKYMLSQILAA